MGVSLRVDQQIELHHAMQTQQLHPKSLLTLSDDRMLAMLRTVKGKDSERYAWSEGHEHILRAVLDGEAAQKVI